ncbi:MAG: pyridoxamine 5'-phosphate oxidase [Verrucomicrobia bacterium]|jgi:pyridoxamine 5'-phosphate oxidase|nr:pyridoxamine 5'-phosphate oxidase [Verrucomicrobiota bacterium]MBT7067942.1 pyridoxamine 5'-phosphate oxidase [Verrucomicrobiota bacterium]MBT7700589.1 pyridoxamine 5'-phosphate oxidase [Verrucomicrobiota bacterium]
MHEQDVPTDPLELFSEWLADAREQTLYSGVTLATVAPDGQPSARVVLLRGHDERGFVFYTNYESRKAAELETNPLAAMLFWWRDLRRQIRIEGQVDSVSREESEAYFRSRPHGHQLGAWVSAQSQVIPGRETLDQRLIDVTNRFGDRDVPCPPQWGGYRLVPAAIEFWEEGEHRLHDRLRYRRGTSGWILERLAP